jgi:hypothetical protein
MNDDIYRHPISFGEKLREFSALNAQDEITKSLLATTNANNVTEFLVGMVYGTNFQERLEDVKIEARGPEVLELADALENIQWYESFRGPALSCQLQYLYHKGYVTHVRFGKEYSPVVYVKPPYCNQSIQEGLVKDEIVKSLKRLNPDRIDESERYWIRASWG